MTTYTTQEKDKKAYETPRLVVYGDVHELTRNGGGSQSDTVGLGKTQ